jgi:hypothetical protein
MISFLGKKDYLQPWHMHEVLKDLLGGTISSKLVMPDNVALEAACHLLRTVGKKLEAETKCHLNEKTYEVKLFFYFCLSGYRIKKAQFSFSCPTSSFAPTSPTLTTT